MKRSFFFSKVAIVLKELGVSEYGPEGRMPPQISTVSQMKDWSRLADLLELEPDCRHEGQIIEYVHGHPKTPLKAKCSSCGIELQAVWKAKE